MTYNVFGGTLNLAQSINANHGPGRTVISAYHWVCDKYYLQVDCREVRISFETFT